MVPHAASCRSLLLVVPSVRAGGTSSGEEEDIRNTQPHYRHQCLNKPHDSDSSAQWCLRLRMGCPEAPWWTASAMPAGGYSAPRPADKPTRMTNVADPHGFFARCSPHSLSWLSAPSFSRVSLGCHLEWSLRKKPVLFSAWRMATLYHSDISSTEMISGAMTPRNCR